ncbi:MAG: NrfD/PsrC family molybdoenzyme membrane anchor subunit, partial [Thermodesulfobacteriota bacterium]
MRGFPILTALLIVLTLAGFISFIISYTEGHHVFGTNNLIPWGMPIVITIYLIGLSAGSLILSSLTYVFKKEEYRPISRITAFLAIVLIFGAMVGIALDLGRPEKSWRLFMFFILNNMRSMFAINGILYGGYFLIGIIYLGAILSNKHKLIKRMGIVAVLWASLVHMGTGAIFGFIDARPIYFSPIKPFEFLAAALASGLGLLIMVVVAIFKFTKLKLNENLIFSLGRLLLALVI